MRKRSEARYRALSRCLSPSLSRPPLVLRRRKERAKKTKTTLTVTASALSTLASSANVTKPNPRETPSFLSTTQSSISPNCRKWSRKVSSSTSPVPPTKSLRPRAAAAAAAALVAAEELLFPADGGTPPAAAAASGAAAGGTAAAGAETAAAPALPDRGTAALASTRLPLMECGPCCFFVF